jgi:hypothetical protein
VTQCRGPGFTKPWDHRFPRFKKPAGIPVKPTGSLRFQIYSHGLGVGTGPVRVPSRTGSTGNRPNRTGSHRLCKPWSWGFSNTICHDCCCHHAPDLGSLWTSGLGSTMAAIISHTSNWWVERVATGPGTIKVGSGFGTTAPDTVVASVSLLRCR